jgi:hypothetical protein
MVLGGRGPQHQSIRSSGRCAGATTAIYVASECKECKSQTVVSAGLEAYNVKYHFTDDTMLSSEDCTLELWLHKLVRYSLIFFWWQFFCFDDLLWASK